MQTHPVVDVIIPVYNGARYIEEAIQSVLSQSYHPVRLIVVDDGSQDDSADLAERMVDVHVIRCAHVGISAALNQGIQHGSGDLIAFLDADDRWRRDKLALQVDYLQTHPDVGMVFGHVQQFHEPDRKAGEIETLMPPQPGISRCAMLIWRTVFETVGGFTEDGQAHDFGDWYARAQEGGVQSHLLPDVVFERRIHEDNYGRRVPQIQRQSYMHTLRAALARRRGSTASSYDTASDQETGQQDRS